jgi:hypothetical protein
MESVQMVKPYSGFMPALTLARNGPAPAHTPLSSAPSHSRLCESPCASGAGGA